ncbi:MAG: hypothetical protein LUG50_03360 [Planctomycetaceae bacterium]|nr:hypothetical protein [Planctomycetaceae bacterium]
MTSKTFYASLAFAIAITFAWSTAQAEDGEFYVNTYRSLGTVSPQGVRSAAMGRAGRGLADGVYSLGVNPAALGAQQGAAIDVALGFDWLDDGYDNADQVTFKLGGAVSLDRWSRLAGPNQAVGALLHTQNYSGASNNSMKRNQTGVLMAYGLHFMENLLGGVSVALYDGDWKSEPMTGRRRPRHRHEPGPLLHRRRLQNRRHLPDYGPDHLRRHHQLFDRFLQGKGGLRRRRRVGIA